MRRVSLAIAAMALMTASGFGAALTTEVQIKTALIGNTVFGLDNGEKYFEFFAPDGTIRGLGSDGSYTGQWKINGAQFCVRYPEAATNPDEWSCMGIDVSGDKFAWIDQGQRYEAVLSSGNPYHL